MEIRHMATQDWWQVKDGDLTYTVRRHDQWDVGDQSWTVQLFDEQGFRHEVTGEKFHELVRLIQNHLVRRDGDT